MSRRPGERCQSPQNESSRDTLRSEETAEEHGIEKIESSHEGVLSKVLSKTISRTSTLDPGPPPDGGFDAWTQALLSHLIVFNTWGYINSFGVFQTYC